MLSYEIFFFMNLAFTCTSGEYEPTWQSLDSRPLPSWFYKDKIGIRLYWGVYVVPVFKSQLFFQKLKENDEEIVPPMKETSRPEFKYADYAPEFNGEFFDADRWVSLFQKAGMKFMVLYTNHEDVYNLFPSKKSLGGNSEHVGPLINVADELAKASRKHKLKFGISYSLDTCSKCDHVMAVLKQQVDAYKPWMILPSLAKQNLDSDWTSTKLLAYLYNESPVKDNVVVSDGWGDGSNCSHGCICFDKCRDNPEQKWMDDLCLSRNTISCSYRRKMKFKDVLKIEEVLAKLVETVSSGGNFLINVGPNDDGMIDPIFEERLLQIGEWLSINGKAIYNSSPWTNQNAADDKIYYTCRRNQNDSTSEIDELYAIFLKWPGNNMLQLKGLHKFLKLRKMVPVALLGNEEDSLSWRFRSGDVNVTLPGQHVAKSRWAWVLQFMPDTRSYRKSARLNYYFNLMKEKIKLQSRL